MFEDYVEVEGLSTDSTMASSVSACKKVLCGNSVLDSPDFWLKNEKTLCRLGLADEDSECTMICFVNVDSQKTTCREEQNVKKLASVSPGLPRLVEVMTAQQPK
ncbi:unnamed protein product [Knipowitschia caucasica]|uniref:Uncharacterized protein n=1 Tax=Knipowitschia caucasica TaxID=637954 RepID=A0AAV2J3E3_KNICA